MLSTVPQPLNKADPSRQVWPAKKGFATLKQGWPEITQPFNTIDDDSVWTERKCRRTDLKPTNANDAEVEDRILQVAAIKYNWPEAYERIDAEVDDRILQNANDAELT